jgi:hypothetical protein
MYLGTLILSGSGNSKINWKRRMSQYPSPFATYPGIPLFIISENRFFLGANGKNLYTRDKLM